jgi:pimeloyl-ACP methyl ester carboxylesterase
MRKRFYFVLPVAAAVIVATVLIAKLVLFHGAAAPASALAGSGNRVFPHTLVIISPGMTGNAEFWPDVVRGKATFASELRRGAGDVELYSYLWNGGWDHQSREAAAKQLATVIDQKSAAGFTRICLVGHSFGGDICLRAAGLCKAKIEMAICMATPHTYLTMLSTENHPVNVPVYCSWESRQNIKTLVNLYPENDEPLVDLANSLRAWELSETQAIPLTQSWQEHMGFPRLANDSFEKHLLGREPNLAIANYLNVADVDVRIQSFVKRGGVLQFAEHQAFHSRRIGYVLGELIRDGATPARVDYLKSLVQPEDSDNGNAISLEDQQAWLRDHQQDLIRAGWRLTKISVDLLPEANRVAKNLDSSLVSSFVKVTTSNGRRNRTVLETETLPNNLHAAWQTEFVLWNTQTDCLWVMADHDIFPSDDLGHIMVSGADNPPPARIAADPADKRYWSAECIWEAVHF